MSITLTGTYMTDRIKLAEAMFETEENSLVIGKNRELMWLTDKNGKAIGETIRPIPDPFTDANDDYAVLEWIREKYGGNFWVHFENTLSCNYQIGDYARAAIATLDERGTNNREGRSKPDDIGTDHDIADIDAP